MVSDGRHPFAAIVGPSGWGKSHLLHSVAASLAREGARPILVNAGDADLQAVRLDSPSPLLIDDVEGLLDRPRARQQLRALLERRVRARRTTLLATADPRGVRGVRSLVPSPREWVVANISTPQVPERELIVRHLAGLEGLELGRPIVQLLARGAGWNGHQLSGALKRLKLVQPRWTEVEDALRAFGLLAPFFGDGDAFDVRDQAYAAIEMAYERDEFLRNGIEIGRASVYLMRRTLLIGEEDVAVFFQMEPGEVFAIVQDVQRDVPPAVLRTLEVRFAEVLLASIEGLT